MGNQQGKNIEVKKAWLAGFLDGEGSFHAAVYRSAGLRAKGRRKLYRPVIKVINTHIPTLNYVTGILDEMELPYHVYWRHPENPKWSTSWGVEVAGFKRCLRWTQAFKDYVLTKREDVENMLEWCHLTLVRPLQGKTPIQYSPHEEKLISSLRGRRGRELR